MALKIVRREFLDGTPERLSAATPPELRASDLLARAALIIDGLSKLAVKAGRQEELWALSSTI
jgi:hypothetical protein